MTGRHDREQSAQRALDKLRREGDALGGIFPQWRWLRTIDSSDPIELWGTRIGRSLSLLAVIAICLYLVWIYVR